MRTVVTLAFFALMLMSSVSLSDERQVQAIDQLEEQFFSSKKQAVLLRSGLDREENKNFWELYDAYEQDMRPIVRSMIESLYTFDKQSDTLTNAEADEIMDRLVLMSNKSTALQQRYLEKFRAILPAKKVLHIAWVIYTG